jgi:hypothetical protein
LRKCDFLTGEVRYWPDPDPKLFIPDPDPDPAKGRIRIHNTARGFVGQCRRFSSRWSLFTYCFCCILL